MPFNIVRHDITKMEVDAIVNAANTELRMSGGVCGAIFNAAGVEQMTEACSKLAPIKTGEAVITPGFALPARHVIHAAGPVYKEERMEQNETLLRAAYTNSLRLAVEHKLESVAFPLISSGIFGYRKDDALRIATSDIKDFLSAHELDVTLVVFDKSSFRASRELLAEVESYIDEHYIGEYLTSARQLLQVEQEAVFGSLLSPPIGAPLGDLVGDLDEPFSQMLLRLIDAKGLSDVTVYKRANVSRKLFSKIRSQQNYMPSKRTVLALAIGMELSLEETEDLLSRAGYALSGAVKFDVIIQYFIAQGIYDIFTINEVLFSYDQPLLGV